MNFSELFKVTIAFEHSHLIFPRIIHWMMLILIIIIAFTRMRPYLRDVRSGKKSLPFTDSDFKPLCLFGTLALTIVYFIAMDYVGDFFPNTGLGFLITSMPYMFALSCLYVHKRDRRHLMFSAICAIISPTVAWYVLTKLLNVTLP